MSLTPEQHNRTIGPALVVLVMDTIRTLAAQEPTTQPAVVKAVASTLGMKAPHRSRLYWNVCSRVKALARAGYIVTERRQLPNGGSIAYTTIIKLPDHVRS
jgi:hypothetical protein